MTMSSIAGEPGREISVGITRASIRERLAGWIGQYLLLIPLLVAALLAPMNQLRPMQHLTYADITLLIAAGAMLFRQLARRTTAHLPIPLVFVLPPLVILWGGLIQPLATDDYSGLLYVGQYVIASTMVPLTIFWSVQGDTRAQLMVGAAWVCGIAFSALVGIGSHHGFSVLGFSDPWASWHWGGYRIAGLSYHPNMLALCSAMALSLLAIAAIMIRNLPVRLAIAGLIVEMIYTLDLAGSRAALAGALLVLPLALWIGLGQLDFRHRLKVFAAGGVIVAVAVAGIMGLGGEFDNVSAFDRILGGGTSAHSDYKRDAIRDQAFSDFFANPVLGVGYDRIRDAHNFFLQFLQSGGLVGISGFLAYVAVLAYLALRGWMTSQTSHERLLVVALASAVAAWLLIGLYQNAIIERAVYIPIGLLLAQAYRSERPG